MSLHVEGGGVLGLQSVVLDTRTMNLVEKGYVYVPRWRGDVAELYVAARYPANCHVDTWDELLLEDAQPSRTTAR